MWLLINNQLDFLGLLTAIVIALGAHWRLVRRCHSGSYAFRICAMLVACIMMTGYLFVREADLEQRTNLISHMRAFATTYAAELSSLDHARLTNEVHADDRNYLKLIEAQNRWLKASDLISDIYTLRRTADGSTLLLVDSETDYDGDGLFTNSIEARTPPGQPYFGFNSDEKVNAAFSGQPVFISEPYSDAWGTWVSALQPMFNDDKSVEGVLGVDFPAAIWAKQILNARLSIIGILAIIQGMLIGSAAMHTLTQHHLKEQQEAAERLQQFKTTLDQTLDSVFMFRPGDYRLIYVNEGAKRHVGFTEDELLSMSLLDFSPAMTMNSFQDLIQPLYDGTLPLITVETLHRHRNGKHIPVEMSLQFVKQSTSTPGFVAIVRDITERKQVEYELLKAARLDRLTGLPNRSLFHDRLKHFMQRTKQIPGYRFALMFLDFDRFKNINDSLGHEMGDELLREIASRLKQGLDPVESISPLETGTNVARLGGDEFVVILDNLDHPETACQIASQLLDTLNKDYLLGSHQVQSTASIGVVCSHHRYESGEDMLRDADAAMYQAKAKGKACYVLYESRAEASLSV